MSGDALKEIRKDLYLMLNKSREMLDLTEDAFTKNRIAQIDQAEELAGEIQSKEDLLTEKLAKLSSTMPEARAMISVPAHVEKIAATIKRVQDNVRSRIKDGMLFSDKAIQETGIMFVKAKELLKKAGEAMVAGTRKQAEDIIAESDALERLVSEFTTAHENRIVSGESTPKSSTVYLCILYAFEDMAGHVKNAVRKIGS